MVSFSYGQSPQSLDTISFQKNSNAISYLQQKMDLSLAVNGEFARTLGNVFAFFWNAGMRYEKDENGNQQLDLSGNPILLHPENKLDYSNNIIGGELKLDYHVGNFMVVSTGINGTLFPEDYYGVAIDNSGYFCETQLKVGARSDVYIYGQFGSVTSTFANDLSLRHYQYTTGLGIGNDYVGFDIGVNFFSTPTEKKGLFLEDYTYSTVAESYLDSARVMLRLTAKFF